MSHERRGPTPEGAPPIKVFDRRRIRPDGEPSAEGAGEDAEAAVGAGGAMVPSEPAQPVDERDERLAAQASRIDELSRAHAALLEDNKAYRTRLEREQARVIEAERASVAQALLEASDDLERALAAVAAVHGAQGDALRNLIEGVRLSLAALQRRIAGLGAVKIEVVGRRFDPLVSEAVDAVPVSDEERDGVVVQEVRSGYRIGEKILRPARVRVGRLARA